MDEALRFSQSHGVRAGCQALDLPPSSRKYSVNPVLQ